MDSLIFITGSKSTFPFVEAAKKRGIRVVLFDIDPQAYCKPVSDIFFEISIVEKEKILNEINQLTDIYNFIGVISYSSSEKALITASYLSNALDLKSYSGKSVKITYNKCSLYQTVQKTGINVPQRYSLELIRNLNTNQNLYPMIVKPRDGIGSKGIKIVNSQQEFSELKGDKNNFIFESYIEGDLFHIDGFVQDGVANVLSILSKKVEIIHGIPLTKGYIPKLEMAHSKKYQAFVSQIKSCISAIGINNQFFGADFIFDINSEKYFLLEIGYLLDAKIDRLLHFSGYDIYSMLINIVIGNNVNVKNIIPTTINKSLEFIYADRIGNLKIYECQDMLLEWEKNDGESVQVPESIADILGWYIYDDFNKSNLEIDKFFKIV